MKGSYTQRNVVIVQATKCEAIRGCPKKRLSTWIVITQKNKRWTVLVEVEEFVVVVVLVVGLVGGARRRGGGC